MIHPLSDCQAIIPETTRVWQYCVILPQAVIGEECNICSHCFIENDRGNLTVVQSGDTVPFDIRRVFYIYDIPGGEARGAHAHKACHQFLVAASGSFDVILDDGKKRTKYSLNRSYHGLYIPTMHWREIENFSSGAVCMVLASEHYDESDYIYEYEDFKKEVSKI